MTDVPETRYTRSADGTNLAYQVSGNGPLETVFVNAAIPIDLLSEDPSFVRLRRRLDPFSRTVWFDRRGTGTSEGDPHAGLPGDTSDADFNAVFNAAAFDRPVLVAEGASGLRAIHFSATHPERVSALILINGFAHYVREDDYPWGVPPDRLDRLVAVTKEEWGSAATLEQFAPNRAGDERFRGWFARATRFGGGPDLVAEMTRADFEVDVRPLLDSISAPTLVLHRGGNRFIRIGAGRYLADHIPGARLVVLSGDEHAFFLGDIDALADEIEDFLTGTRSGAEGDLVTLTVLFTDIVASTDHQTRVGQRQWSRLTDLHDAIVRAALTRNRGHEVKTTGDGFLATFNATGRALRCAAEILADVRDIGLNLRAGVHAGEVEVRGDDIAGLAVTIAKRVCDLAGPGQVLLSETARGHLIGAGMEFADQGQHNLKGLPGSWQLFSFVA